MRRKATSRAFRVKCCEGGRHIVAAMIDRRAADRLVGESLGETGILLLVFAPLDALFEPHGPGELLLTSVIVGSLILIALGIIVETWMRE